MRLNVGVIFGGKSVEHELGILTAVSVIKSLNPNKYNVVPIYIDKDNNWYTGYHLKDILNYRDISLVKRYATKVCLIKKGKQCILQSMGLIKKSLYAIDVILPVGQGTYLEDGSLQGYLEMLGVPYAGSNLLASALGTDKILIKQLLQFNNIPVPEYSWFYDIEFNNNKKAVLEKINKLHYPLYVKPASLGSSIGISLVNDETALVPAIKTALQYDKKIIVEEKVKNIKEVNLSVIGNLNKCEVSDICEINVDGDEEPSEEYLDKVKYLLLNQYRKYIKVPEQLKKTKPLLSKEMKEDIKKYAIDTFKIINASGMAKIDFLLDEKNKKIFVSEIDTIPCSLALSSWASMKKTKEELLDELIRIAFENKKDKDKLTHSFKENLLESYDILLEKNNSK